eukprot:GHRR01007418.1.p1 GENE.GHRR01007418.1~~GHRR01007418.1.p1  ORF type:complete len:106 (+),score=12.11 GHRR01007418.1:515-832(+)
MQLALGCDSQLCIAVLHCAAVQVVAHHVKGYNAAASCNQVDADPVPVPHFGAALSLEQFHQLAERLKSQGVAFTIQPHLRFQGSQGNSGRCSSRTLLATAWSSRP